MRTRLWLASFLLATLASSGLAHATPAIAPFACEGAKRIRLTEPVEFTEGELAEFRSMPPLRVLSVDAPPMAGYNKNRRTYTGIGPDVLCFIANQLGLRYEIVPGRDLTVTEKLLRVQEGEADMFMPLSRSTERAQQGLFTLPYYESHYAAIARKDRHLSIRDLADLAPYQVSVVAGVAFEPLLRNVVPASNLHIYSKTSSDDLFKAVQSGDIDVAVFSKDIFIEKRYDHEYFDLGVIHTFFDDPRAYRFYFSRSPQNERIVEAFDRYLAAADLTDTVVAHANGERQLLQRYVSQRSQRIVLQVAIVAAVLLTFAFYLAVRRYRRMSRRLAESNRYIRQQQKALLKAYEEVEQRSQTDALTRLANRRHFDQALTREQARRQRTGAPLSLLLIDVDYFKAVNDHYGHAVGDDYLKAIARALGNNVKRPTDLAARYGGEEFACLLPDTSAESARLIAECIRRDVAELELPNPLPSAPRLTVSTGIATVVSGKIRTRELLGQADEQLYLAKSAGRNRIMATVVSA